MSSSNQIDNNFAYRIINVKMYLIIEQVIVMAVLNFKSIINHIEYNKNDPERRQSNFLETNITKQVF